MCLLWELTVTFKYHAHFNAFDSKSNLLPADEYRFTTVWKGNDKPSRGVAYLY